MADIILNNLISIIIILFLIYGFVSGAKFGFLKKVVSCGTLIITIIITRIFTPVFATMIKDVTNISSTLTDIIYSAIVDTNIYNDLKVGTWGNIIGTGDIGSNIKNNICINISNGIINVGCAIIIFVAGVLIIKFLIKILEVVDYIPVIGQINTLLGGFFGILEKLLIIYLIFMIIRIFADIPYVAKIVGNIKASNIGNVLYENNVVYNFFGNLFGMIKK